ncbi:MAG: DNA polymerase III subunit delta', partial [Eubacteriales bacterium]|nr:DNA polymerase III subunit delta' [Eubacteriales bacterium]
MNFSDIEGQRHIADILSSSLAHDRAGHAYLFTGPEGIGKKTVAGIFARLLLCLDEGAAKGQGTCGSCLPCSLAEAGTC